MSKNFVFGGVPSVSYRRSRFDLSHDTKTSMSVGTLYPIDVTEVIPGDTFRMHTAQVARLSSAFIRPVMDNCYMDVYYFFVPNRLVFDEWENVFGQNDDGAWAQAREVQVPMTQGVVYSGSIADYMGLPPGYYNEPCINLLPFRAFALIYNQWFRNENVIDPMNVQKGEMTASETFTNAEWSPANYTGMPPKVGKRKDYFTSCLPAPQKGSAVGIPALSGVAPVVTTSTNVTGTSGGYPQYPLNFGLAGKPDEKYTLNGVRYSLFDFGNSSEPHVPVGSLTYSTSSTGSSGLNLAPVNLVADLSNAGITNINDFRFAFQLQKFLEKDARYGTRYNEFLLGHFGVSNPDSRLQLPEFLGGARMPINIQQVAQTNTQTEASGSVQSPLASLGAFSHSVGKSRFTKSFTEHGFVIVCACIRQFHTYQQGVQKFWSRKGKYDYYDPLFANLGEQPVYTSELFVPPFRDGVQTEIGDLKANVFGYQEYAADYRYKPSMVTGEMRSVAQNTLDVWHFADEYENAPVLSKEFIEETPKFFDRTVAVPSTSQDNFIVDFHFDFLRYSVIPTYSVPGLIDHH